MNKKSRRKALKALAAAAPVVWAKPVVDSVVLPAHAEVSGNGSGIENLECATICDDAVAAALLICDGLTGAEELACRLDAGREHISCLQACPTPSCDGLSCEECCEAQYDWAIRFCFEDRDCETGVEIERTLCINSCDPP